MQIDQIIASNHAKSPPRREKIYCDKWIHDGTCAFVQVGCKYKHVMPTDKLTQVSLGLNHGFPGWYRRLNRDALEGYQGSSPTDPSPPQSLADHPYSNSRARIDENWRGLAAAKTGNAGARDIPKMRSNGTQSKLSNPMTLSALSFV